MRHANASQTHMADIPSKTVAFTYDGNFSLDFLLVDEKVRSAGDRTGACEIVRRDGTVRVNVGDRLHRRSDGRIVVTAAGITDSQTQQEVK